ncbi:hypothetical protein [Myroides sp.]|uniref:hypothetical protein n=1 Tax=Myroides sp. TaxID=1874736 RepID=UPI003F2B3D77
MKNNKHIRKYITALLLTFFVGISAVFAQAEKQYGTRISDTKTGKSLRENVILELDSKDKGFMLPRVTTAQRDRLVKDKKADNGLAIYNIDIDCVEFWSERTEKWMSVCGSLPPATLDLASGSCAKITFSGIVHETVKDVWQQGKPLPDNAVMIIDVKVESTGTYSISASTDNGYFFSGEGQFQAIGNYKVSLKAMGTPINGYVQTDAKTGDSFTFTFNGKESTGCPNAQLKIVPADLEFMIKPAPNNTYVADGTYIVNKAASGRDGHKINVDINVTSPGVASITALSNTDLGMKFSGTVDATAGTGSYTVVLEPVAGENIPKTNVNANYELTFSTNTKSQSTSINSQKASIVISETKIEPVGTKATFGTTNYYAGETLTANHTITLPIKVTAAGKTTLRLKDATGNYEFEAKDVELDNPAQPTDEQLVTFKAKSLIALPATVGNLELTLSGDQTRLIIGGTDKVVKVPVAIKPVEYRIQCNTLETSRPVIPLNVDLLQDTFVITVKVDVIVPGEYEIKTNGLVDKLSFSSNRNGVKQKFTSAGPNQEVKLYVVGTNQKATTKGPYNVTLVSNDANTANPCTNVYEIKVGFKDLNILLLRDDYEEYSKMADFLGNNHFGPKGSILETAAVNVKDVNVDFNLGDYSKPALIAYYQQSIIPDIKAGKYDIIIAEKEEMFGKRFTNDLADAVYEFITVKKGFFIAGGYVGGDTDAVFEDIISHKGSAYIRDNFLKKLNNN